MVSLNFTGLSSPQTAAHLHGPPLRVTTRPERSWIWISHSARCRICWNIQPVGGLSVLQQVVALKARTDLRQRPRPTRASEIRGWLFVIDDGIEDPPDPGGGGFADAARFLEQATFGPTVAEANRVLQIGFDPWLNEQFALPITGYNNLVTLQQGTFVSYPRKLQFFRNAMTAPDQLRQRVAWALSQIVVAANIGDQDGNGNPTAMVSNTRTSSFATPSAIIEH